MFQHDSFNQKIEYAKLTRNAEQKNRLILVDNLEGAAHQAYGARANMAYVINEEGIVQLRHKWVDPEAIEVALNILGQGHPIANYGYSMKGADPVIAQCVMSRASKGAMNDCILASPGLPYHMFEEHYTE